MTTIRMPLIDSTDTYIFATLTDGTYARFVKLATADGSSVVEKQIDSWGTTHSEPS
jgi:hypothetical protein